MTAATSGSEGNQIEDAGSPPPDSLTSKNHNILNCGYDPTCSGWVVRDGDEHVATFRREADANEYIELLTAYISADETTAEQAMREFEDGTGPLSPEETVAGIPVVTADVSCPKCGNNWHFVSTEDCKRYIGSCACGHRWEIIRSAEETPT